ncbi:MAG TPA: GNAT family N-acetyltransferase [Jiangellaceae bacterium]
MTSETDLGPAIETLTATRAAARRSMAAIACHVVEGAGKIAAALSPAGLTDLAGAVTEAGRRVAWEFDAAVVRVEESITIDVRALRVLLGGGDVPSTPVVASEPELASANTAEGVVTEVVADRERMRLLRDDVCRLDEMSFPSPAGDGRRESYVERTDEPAFGRAVAVCEGAVVGATYGRGDSSPWNDLLIEVDGGVEPITEDGLAAVMARPNFHVVLVVIDPDWRGRGIAGQLLRELMVSRAEPQATLHVEPDNAAALSLYERLGWRRAGVKADGQLLYTRP